MTDVVTQPSPCICGTRRPPKLWRKYSRSSGMRLRCPACSLSPSLASDARLGGPSATSIWNEFIAQERAKLPPPEPREGILVWPPTPGYYAMRLVKDGPRVAVRIWFGKAIIDGEEQDRGDDWRCEIDGETDYLERDRDTGYECHVPLHIDRVWPRCTKADVKPVGDSGKFGLIPESEYRYLVKDASHAKEWRPEHPKASPREPVDFNTMPLPF